MPVDLPQEPPADAPEELEALWPLVLRWGESDDAMRADRAPPDRELRGLLSRVEPTLRVIDEYLDRTHDAEHAVPVGDLAQAAIEARFTLARGA